MAAGFRAGQEEVGQGRSLLMMVSEVCGEDRDFASGSLGEVIISWRNTTPGWRMHPRSVQRRAYRPISPDVFAGLSVEAGYVGASLRKKRQLRQLLRSSC